MTQHQTQPWSRVLAAVAVATTVAQLPVFLIGASALNIRHDLHFGSGQLGLVVSTFWIAMGVGGFFGARMAHRRGSVATIAIGVAVTAISLVTLASSSSWLMLLLSAGLSGVGVAIVTPAGDMALLAVVPVEYRGLAYGVKQSSLPAASLLAGLGVPALVLTVGWRWTMVAALVLVVIALVLVPRELRDRAVVRGGTGATSGRHTTFLADLVPVAVAVAFAMAGVSAMGAFYVESAVAGGQTNGSAGLFLAVGGICGVAGRFLFSWRLGHLSQTYGLVALLMALGGLGVIVFAIDKPPAVLLAGTVVAFGAGWGWNGLLTQTAVVSHPMAPARASAHIMAGAAVGGVVGPTVFGFVAAHGGDGPAWLVCTGLFLAAAAVLVATDRTRRFSDPDPAPPRV